MKLIHLGTSSHTLLALHLGGEYESPRAPADEWDMKRCDSLMEFLGLSEGQKRSLLWRAAIRYPDWEPVVRRWDARTYSVEAEGGRG